MFCSVKCSVVLQDGTGSAIEISAFGKMMPLLSSLRDGFVILENLQAKGPYINFIAGLSI